MSDERTPSQIVVAGLEVLIAKMRPFFPHHAATLAGEIIGTKMTNDRWNRVASTLAALNSVPGVALSPAEHDVRNFALAAMEVARKMATATFTDRGSEQAFEFAQWRMTEICSMMAR